MALLLDEQGIAERLKLIVEYLGGRDKIEELAGIDKNSLSNYANLSGGRKASNLVTKLIPLGINGNWYLTGSGEMLIRDMQSPSTDDRHAMEFGRRIADALSYGLENGVISTVSGTPAPDDVTITIPPPRQGAGPSPSREDVERWRRSQQDSVPSVHR